MEQACERGCESIKPDGGANPPASTKKRNMIIIAIEDFILLFVFFALINCPVGAYLQYRDRVDNDYFITSYFTWFFLWWIILPRTVIKFVNSKLK